MKRIAARTRLFVPATSHGGVESLIEHRASVEGPKSAVPANLLRLSIGIEKAVSAFANTAGGDLLLGVEAVEGVATALPGLDLDNPDGETLRLENMIRDGLEPRLPRVDIRAVEVAEHRYVVVVRVARSWIAPHRVRKNDEFYARNSAGTYPLDVGELRTAFTMSETVAARIRDFRTDRLARILGRETPVGLNAGGCMVVHVLPLSAFTAAVEIDIAAYEAGANRLSPMAASGWY